MGCCLWFTRNNYNESSLEKNIKDLNKITNSKYFYERSKIKIKFSLINKRRIKVAIVILNFITKYLIIFSFFSPLFGKLKLKFLVQTISQNDTNIGRKYNNIGRG